MLMKWLKSAASQMQMRVLNVYRYRCVSRFLSDFKLCSFIYDSVELNSKHLLIWQHLICAHSFSLSIGSNHSRSMLPLIDLFIAILFQLKNLSDDACKADDPSLAQVKPKCCKKTAVVRSKCLTKLLLNNIAKAKRAGKKICPINS